MYIYYNLAAARWAASIQTMDLILGLVTLEATRWTANKTKYNATHVHIGKSF